MLMALIALIGVFVSLYLTLFKLGYIGTLACGTGGCETVQLSRWGDFLGLPVAAWGAVFYLIVLALSLAGTQQRYELSPGLSVALLLVTLWGLLFTAWLTYLELFRIHAICRWCVGSAVMVLLLFILALWDWRESAEPRG
jgi:uncharacterized membrane protein